MVCQYRFWCSCKEIWVSTICKKMTRDPSGQRAPGKLRRDQQGLSGGVSPVWHWCPYTHWRCAHSFGCKVSSLHWILGVWSMNKKKTRKPKGRVKCVCACVRMCMRVCVFAVYHDGSLQLLEEYIMKCQIWQHLGQTSSIFLPWAHISYTVLCVQLFLKLKGKQASLENAS